MWYINKKDFIFWFQDIEFTRMLKKIKLPDSGGLEAAAADFGAQRAAIIASAPPAIPAQSFGGNDLQNVKSKEVSKDDDDEDELC